MYASFMRKYASFMRKIEGIMRYKYCGGGAGENTPRARKKAKV